MCCGAGTETSLTIGGIDGSGYFVTRYDLRGSYTTIPGAHDPGSGSSCDGDMFTSGQTGPWNGVWTMKVTIDHANPIDYNPDAQPEGNTWDEFLQAVFNTDTSDSNVSTASYEFDYYSDCNSEDHWRDSNYGGVSLQSGGISSCD